MIQFNILLYFFAGVYHKKRKIFIGENQKYNQWSNSLSTHAEIDALNRLKSKNINIKRYKFDLLVIRISKTGKLGESRPCYHCLKKLEESGIKIKNVYYSTNLFGIQKEKFNLMKDSDKTTYSRGYRTSMRKHKNIEKLKNKNII